jgi:outer membrane protein assembly factor BamD
MRYLVNALSSYEVHVSDYYYRRGAYVAAVNRAQASLTNFPRTPANEDALIILVRGYEKLGLPQLRDDAQRILASTYPNGKWTLSDARPWWKFWGKDEAVQLLEHDTVPKAKADEGIPPP